MTERSQETVQRQDLTSRLALVPQGVLEILGETEVEQIERQVELLEVYNDIVSLPDPFEGEKAENGSIFDTQTRVAIDEVRWVYEDTNVPPREVIEVARLHAQFLAKVTKKHTQDLRKSLNSIADDIYILTTNVKAVDVDKEDDDKLQALLPDAYGKLCEIASRIPGESVFKHLVTLNDAEFKALFADKEAVGSLRKPDLWEHYKRLLANSRARKAYHESRTEILTQLIDEGEKDRKLRRAHRSWSDIHIDEEYIEKCSNFAKKQDLRGSAAYHLVIDTAVGSAKPVASQLFEELWNSKNSKLAEALQSAPDLSSSSVIEAEDYIASKAAFVESVFRKVGVKMNPVGRRMMHELKDTRLKRSITRLADTAINGKNGNPYEDIEVDGSFRSQCRDARDILVGGGRINHPDARRLAEELHKLRLGRDQSTSLEPTESGIVVGIVANQINSLVTVVERLETATEGDYIQAMKLRYELPEQYAVLSNFDLNVCIEKLKVLFDDEEDRQAIFGILGDLETVERVRKTVNDLWLRRIQGQETEVLADTPQEHPEHISEVPKEEELRIIDTEMTNIAEQLEWVVFPPGTTVQDVRNALGIERIDTARVNWDRIKHLLYLANEHQGEVYRSMDSQLGTSVPYLVAEIYIQGRRIAVAECPEIGNATYVVDDLTAAGTWEEVMRLSKAEARSLGAKRVIHPTEEGHLSKIIRALNSILTVSA